MATPYYTNAFKGRPNRRELARHLREEFQRIEDAFTDMQASANSLYNRTVITVVQQNYLVIRPDNGLLQEVDLVDDITLVEIAEPKTTTDAWHLVVTFHGANKKIINGWGPQVWQERGQDDVLFLYTGNGKDSSLVVEYFFDGYTWIGIVFSQNKRTTASSTEETFPFINDLQSISGNETLTFTRSSAALTYDNNEMWFSQPDDEPRFTGARYANNWIADSNDLQSVAWVEDNATVTTEAAGGPTGSDTDRVTFDLTNGRVITYMLPYFGRSSSNDAPLRFRVKFKAKMATAASGEIRLGLAHMGNTLAARDVNNVSLTNAWATYTQIMQPTTADQNYQLADLSGLSRRTLFGLYFQSPAGSVGSPVLIENVHVEIMKEEGEAVAVATELHTTSIGPSIALTADGDSTGTWDNGTKTLTLDDDEYVDFSGNFNIGEHYLCVLNRTSGPPVNVYLEADRLVWTGESADGVASPDNCPFTIRFEGGSVRFAAESGSTSVYNLNIYAISGNVVLYDTEEDGSGVSSTVAEGFVYENVATENLIPYDYFRSFHRWTRQSLTSATDDEGRISSFRGAFGIDGRHSTACIIQDTRTTAAGYVEYSVTIPDDTNIYTMSLFIRLSVDADGQQQYSHGYDQITTDPNRYVDLSMALTGGTTELEGQRVRFDLGTENAAESSDQVSPDLSEQSDYAMIGAITYPQENTTGGWMRAFIGITNNGTGNTTARLRFYPAPGTVESPATLDVTNTGWAIVDWAQLESTTTGIPRGPVHGGETRASESLTSTLDDGYLYDQLGQEIGDITSGTVTFDAIDIYKNILWVNAQAVSDSQLNLHEFGITPASCTDTLDDESDDPILDEIDTGGDICIETSLPYPAPDWDGLMWMYDFNSGGTPNFGSVSPIYDERTVGTYPGVPLMRSKGYDLTYKGPIEYVSTNDDYYLETGGDTGDGRNYNWQLTRPYGGTANYYFGELEQGAWSGHANISFGFLLQWNSIQQGAGAYWLFASGSATTYGTQVYKDGNDYINFRMIDTLGAWQTCLSTSAIAFDTDIMLAFQLNPTSGEMSIWYAVSGSETVTKIGTHTITQNIANPSASHGYAATVGALNSGTYGSGHSETIVDQFWSFGALLSERELIYMSTGWDMSAEFVVQNGYEWYPGGLPPVLHMDCSWWAAPHKNTSIAIPQPGNDTGGTGWTETPGDEIQCIYFRSGDIQNLNCTSLPPVLRNDATSGRNYLEFRESNVQRASATWRKFTRKAQAEGAANVDYYNRTYVVVAKSRVGGNGGCVFTTFNRFFNIGTDVAHELHLHDGTFKFQEVVLGTGSATTVATTTDGLESTFKIFVVTVDNKAVKLYVNNLTEADSKTFTGTAGSGNDTLTALFFADTWDYNYSTVSTNEFNEDLGELAIYDRPLTTDELDYLFTDLKAKWNI